MKCHFSSLNLQILRMMSLFGFLKRNWPKQTNLKMSTRVQESVLIPDRRCNSGSTLARMVSGKQAVKFMPRRQRSQTGQLGVRTPPRPRPRLGCRPPISCVIGAVAFRCVSDVSTSCSTRAEKKTEMHTARANGRLLKSTSGVRRLQYAMCN